jgi:cobalt-zinc-cadmium efflux system protein
MFVVAIFGLAANAVAVLLLKDDSRRNINIRSAYLHLFSDTLSSIAVIFGAIFIFFFKIYWLDPLLTIIIVVYVLKEGYVIIGESLHILMQNVPKDINIKNIQSAIENISGIKNVHHAHVWAITEHDIHFEAHINLVEDIRISESCILKAQIEALLKEKFNINHTTLQFEYESCKGISLIKTT